MKKAFPDTFKKNQPLKCFDLSQPVFPLLFILVFTISCRGQPGSSGSENKTPESVTSPATGSQIDDYVVEILEDTNGNLWFGTIAQGAARYDRNTLTYLSTKDGMIDNTVASMAEDKAGNIWFGTHAGASKYDGKTFANFGKAEGLPGMGCKILADSKGNIWAGTNEGAFRFNGTSFVRFNLPNPVIENPSYKWVAGKIWCLMEDKQGNIWFGRDGFGACKYDGTTFTHFTQKDGLCSNNVASIVQDKQGNLWFGSITSDFPEYIEVGGLCRYDGKAFTQFPEWEGLTQNDIYTVYEDKSGNIWVGAVRIGAYRYDGEKFAFFPKTDREDLTVNFGLQSILEDKNGTLWCGFSGGLFRFDGRMFRNVTQSGPWK